MMNLSRLAAATLLLIVLAAPDPGVWAAPRRKTSPRDLPARSVQLVAVQARWSLANYRDEAAFGAWIEGLMQQVDRRRNGGIPCLVVFPEFIGLPLIFSTAVDQVRGSTRWKEAAAVVITQRQDEVGGYCRKYGVRPVRGLMLARAAEVRGIYSKTFSRAAAQHRCYVVAGSAALPELINGAPRDGNVYNTSLFFGPDGALIGEQKKVHPYGAEGTAEGLDITPGSLAGVRAFDTKIGKVGIAVCYDAWADEVMDALDRQGAVVLAQPSANAHAWDDWQQGDWKKGLWRQVQRGGSFQYGVNPMMVGSLFAPDDEYACDGQSAILAKTAGTRDGSGYLARAGLGPKGQPRTEQVVVATVRLGTAPATQR